MTTRPAFEELQGRIRRDIEHFKGELPDRYALAWYGYLGALIEWDLLSPGDHGRLVALLPSIEDNPANAILLGREES